ncbi:MAG: hypothetical protein ACYTG6_05390 [Planctomycetota bacterium]|jgi:hypothetical protein
MRRFRSPFLIVLLTSLFWIATSHATPVIRGGAYVLPSRGMKQAIEEILTLHLQRLDAQEQRLDAQDLQIAANTAALNAHISDTGNAHDHDARYVMDSGEDLRSFYGVIDGAAGTIISGSGFSLTKLGVGAYRITYDTPFPAPPSVQFVAGHGGLTFVATVNHADLIIFDNAANPLDGAVMFHVVGPQ